MLPAFLLALREGVEAALILGIMVKSLDRLNRPRLKPPVWRGFAAGALLSAAAAYLLFLTGASFSGRGAEIFEGLVMLSAAGVITWMIFWAQHQSTALFEGMARSTSGDIPGAAAGAVFWLAFSAVLREGIELALFLLAARYQADRLGIWSGAALGLAAAGLLGWGLNAGVGQLRRRDFFRVTNLLLLVFAAGLIGMGFHELVEAGIIPPLITPLYNLSAVLAEDSGVGQFLKALLGYNARPSFSESLAYLTFLVLASFGLLEKRRKRIAVSDA